MDNTPVWVLSIAGAIAVLTPAVWKLSTTVNRILEQRRERLKKERKDKTDADNEDERSARQEAWEVVDRLTKELELEKQRRQDAETKTEARMKAMESKVDAVQQRAGRCETEHAATLATLRTILPWAKRRGLPMTPQLEELMNSPPPGSKAHVPLEEKS
jgi:chromosome segregation ATPase